LVIAVYRVDIVELGLLKQMVSPKGYEKCGGNHRKSANFVEEDKQQGGAL
jgi:hypothetical protein